MYDIKIIFGSNVRKLRNKLNLSQDQFSEKIAIGPTTLSVIESGKSFTTSDTINNICTTFNIPASYLFEIDSRYITNEYGNKKEIYGKKGENHHIYFYYFMYLSLFRHQLSVSVRRSDFQQDT